MFSSIEALSKARIFSKQSMVLISKLNGVKQQLAFA
jgi:hypothetical protein